MKTTTIIATLGILLAGNVPAATTLFSEINQPSDGQANLLDTTYRYASDFLTSGSAYTVTGASLKLNNLDNIDHTFTTSIFTDNSGTPGTLVGSFNPFIVPANTSDANYSTTAGGINLLANTPYWEVLQMDEAGGSGSRPQWRSNSGNSTDAGSLFSTISSTGLKASTNSGGSYSDILFFGTPLPGNFQFALTGDLAVPEPSRILLSLVALAAMLLRRRRQS